MTGVNRVTVLGNLGKDPEIRKTQTNNEVATFSVAVNETWKDKATGEKKEQVEWINVVVFGDGLVDVVRKYVKKGSKIYVEGKLKTRKWQDKQGNDRWTTEVVLSGFGSQLVLLDSKDRDGSKPSPEENGYGSHRRAPAADTPAAKPLSDEMNDAIPF